MTEGLCMDKNKRLVITTKLSKDRYLVTHEDNGTHIMNNKGDIIIFEYTTT
jgi:hypothetical protein